MSITYTYVGYREEQQFNTATDPATNAATSTANINSYDGIVVTLTTTGNSQTLQAPSITTSKIFTVVNNDTSTNSLTVVANSVSFTLTPGEAQSFIYDGSAWGPTDLGITAIPVIVAQGGTGLATITDHSVMIGSGTGAVTPIAVGSTGEVLAGSTGADPAFTATPSLTTLTTSKTATSQTLENTGIDITLITDSTYITGSDITYSSARGSSALKLTGTWSGAAGAFSSIYSLITSSGSLSAAGDGVIGIKAVVNNTGALTDGCIYGGQFIAKHNHATNKMANEAPLVGIEGWAYESGAAPAGTLIGGNFGFHNEGTTAKDAGAAYRGVQIFCDNASGAEVPSESTGLCVWNQAGTITNAILIVVSGSGFTNDIVLQNGETINNTTNGFIDISGHLRLAANQNLNVNTATANGNLAGGILIKSGTAASAAVTDGVQLYSGDVGAVGGKAGLHMYNEAGESGPVGWANVRVATRADSNGTIGANEMYGQTHICAFARTYTLPPAALGMNAKFRVTGAVAVSIDTDATGTADAIILDGTELTAGNKITSDSVAYTEVYLECVIADHWSAYTINGVWIDGGA